LLLIAVRSFLALKKQNGLEIYRNILKISCADPLAIGQAWWLLDGLERSPLWLGRFDELTNQESPLTYHVSPLTVAPAAERYRPPFELRASSTR
jgi:hypothetical protein